MSKVQFALPALPYAYDALEPVISAETMRLHHDKHHATYFEKTNDLIQKEGVQAATLEEVVAEARRLNHAKLLNNAGQAWNHSFFWVLMAPTPTRPAGPLASAIEAAFGGLDGLKSKFVSEGADHFGSGWVWLAADGEGLRVMSTHDGDSLAAKDDLTPLLGCDLWEHAYYLDYRNDRKAYLEAWFDALPDWDFAARQFAAARGEGEPWRHPGSQPA